jgi:hypothetical protein
MAVAGEQPYALANAKRQHAIAVVLDLVNPAGPDRRLEAGCELAGLDEAERLDAKVQHCYRRIGAAI